MKGPKHVDDRKCQDANDDMSESCAGMLLAEQQGGDLKRQRLDGEEQIQGNTAAALPQIKSEPLTLKDILVKFFPHLIGNPAFWRAFLAIKDDLPPLADLYEVLREHKPQSVLNNKELILQLCAYDDWIYHILDGDNPLKSDQDIVALVLQTNPSRVIILPSEVRLLYPSFVGQALARCPIWLKEYGDYGIAHMPHGLWQFRDVAVGSAKGGGTFHALFPATLLSNKDVFLAFAQKKPAYEVLHVSENQCNDKVFMLEVVEKNPLLLVKVGTTLKGDIDLAVRALSGDDGAVATRLANFLPDGEGEIDDRMQSLWFKVAGAVREKLLLHDVFVKLVLGSFSEKKPSNLGVLKQDEATTLSWKKLIGDYAGVPVGKELAKQRRARNNLAVGGYHFGLPKC